MSSSIAIKAVTEKLLLVLASHSPTAKSPDKAGNSPLNVFLYHVAVSAAWRNQDLPVAGRGGQPRRPLLALNLYYLISVGEEDQKEAHEKLGQAMLKFHDHPELAGFNANSGIKNQTDPIRLTLQPLTLDEVSKLWSAFQTPYRPSVAYEVGVVLIESEIPEAPPMPVTRRGDEGTGWDTSTRFPPLLTGVRFQTTNQFGAHLGETIALTGANFGAYRDVKVSFRHPLREREKLAPFLITPSSVTEDEVIVTIPNLPDTWPAGMYTVCVLDDSPPTAQPRAALPTNELSIPLLPEIVVPPNLQTTHDTAKNRSLAVPCRPKLMAGQRVQILIGSVEISSVDISDPSLPIARWDKSIVEIPPSERPLEQPFARLKVDGVDSLVYDPANLTQGFDPRFLVQGLP